MKSRVDSILEFAEELERKTSRSFCAAKWKELHLYLHLGKGHSCYHPPAATISADEIKKNPAAIHNTTAKLAERRQMLDGQRPAGCEYCWNLESTDAKALSDRRIKNFEHASGNIEIATKIFKEGVSQNSTPQTIEVSFSNKCNFKCVYCNPKASSYWEDEIKKFGPYRGLENDYHFSETILSENNEYTAAFETWWSESGKHVRALRITGGEPTLHAQMYKIMDDLAKSPRPDLILIINTNLGTSEVITRKLVEKINLIEKSGACKKVRLHVSLESTGERAEYARFGLKYELWLNNLQLVLRETKCEISFMCTYNIFAVEGFRDFLQMLLKWRAEFSGSANRIKIDIPHLVEPRMFHVGILSEKLQCKLQECIEFMRMHLNDVDNMKFSTVELGLLERILKTWQLSKIEPQEKKKLREDFINFVFEADRRRHTNFRQTFPELWEEFAEEAENRG